MDPDDHRVQVLHLTDAGRQILAQVTESRRNAFLERLADWPEDDLARFAACLVRYDAWSKASDQDTASGRRSGVRASRNTVVRRTP